MARPWPMSEWIDDTAAVLEAWMMGQAGGGAIADVLFGRVNPSGKLAETFPLKLADTPAYLNFPGGNGEVRYGEGLFIGYRYYDAKEVPVHVPLWLWPELHDLCVQQSQSLGADLQGCGWADRVGRCDQHRIRCAGKEIVQVYVHDRQSRSGASAQRN